MIKTSSSAILLFLSLTLAAIVFILRSVLYNTPILSASPLLNVSPRVEDWANASCFEPLASPILGSHDLSRILNVGLPKTGSNSIFRLFSKSGFPSRHYHCGQKGFCGTCMKQKHDNGEPMLENCGNFTVWTQMDQMSPEAGCIYPQITLLDQLYEEAPNATWILPFRNVTGWINSVSNWDSHGRSTNMRKRFGSCCSNLIPQLNFTTRDGKLTDDEDFVNLYCNHVKQVRKFVWDHPSLSLVEFSIEDINAGKFLAAGIFPVNSSDWGQENIGMGL